MLNTAIRAEALSKQYRIGQLQRYKALRATITSVLSGTVHAARQVLAGSKNSNLSKEARRHIWALKDVSFTVNQGEVLGVIGHNGSGKSTLLKVLSRITEPTQGWAEVRGRVVSLLEVGTGFHPELTGRENIFLNGAILGMQRREIAHKFDDIVAFSGLEKFIDTPVKHYSSGMYVRLGFSVAAHLDAEVLLVDEVLAVGDAAFQQKCLDRMHQVTNSGRTVLFVSHNMAAIRNLCSRAIVLESGRLVCDAAPEEAIAQYLTSVREVGQPDASTAEPVETGSGRVRILRGKAESPFGEDNTVLAGAPARFIIWYRAAEHQSLVKLGLIITVSDSNGVNIFSCHTGMNQSFSDLPAAGKIVCQVNQIPLIPGEYMAHIVLKDDAGVAAQVNNAIKLRVVDDGSFGLVDLLPPMWGTVVVPHQWHWLPENSDMREVQHGNGS
ncbi:MAG: ABC transporter ATP-binding protein [SAR202 cluster bacterium]|nr:ABC transporter ATP-binding protein [SAR202 cluster bacterium]